MRLSNLSVKFKFGIVFVLAIVLLIGSVIYAVNRVVTREAGEAATEKAKSDLATGYEILDKEYPGPWRREGDKLYKGDTLMNGNYDSVDKIGRLTGDTVTIFCGNTRVATNVMKDGKRAVGTTVSDAVAETVLKKSQDFYGEANVLGNRYQTAYTPIKNPSGEVIGIWYVGASKKFVDNMRSNALRAVGLVSIFGLIIVSIVIWWFFTRQLTNRLSYLVNLAGKVTNGDLTQQMKVDSKDEIGLLAGAFNKMIDNLKAMIADVRNTSDQLAAHSEELAASAEEVSATVEEVAGTTNEVAVMAEKSLENADLTAGESKRVVEVAESGSHTVKQTIDKITSISESASKVNDAVQNLGELSTKIGNITDVITGIADQTNLLALNAAIEAARAGEQGRGFAVVAEEVRKLAEQSAGAAREIGQLITRIQDGVDAAIRSMEQGAADVREGVQMASEAETALKNIVEAVNRNIVLVGEITLGARQTSEGTQQLSAGNEQVTSTIQQVASATQELAGIASKLQTSVAQFKVKE